MRKVFDVAIRGFNQGSDKMARVAAMIEDMYEDEEYDAPATAFRDEGHEVVNIGLESGKKVKGKRGNSETTVEKEVGKVSVDDFDALFIPGGHSPDKLRANDDPVNFVREFMERDKPTFMICHGAQLLITARVLEGRKATGWKSIVQDIKNAGAEYLDQEVVKDGNLISSRQPSDLPAFIEASRSLLEKKE